MSSDSDHEQESTSSSGSGSSDSDSTSSSSRPPIIKKTAPKLQPKVSQKVKKTPLRPTKTKTNMKNSLTQWSHRGDDNSEAFGRDVSQFAFSNVLSCNRVFAIDPNEYDPKVYPPGVLSFIVPQQVSPDKKLFNYYPLA